jgi:hypothetical protein
MSKIKKVFHYLFKQPSVITEELFIRYAKGKNYSDEEYIKKLYFWRKWHRLNLDNPLTFSEKCQWLKLYDHKPIYHQMVDKYDAKQLVASMIGEEYVIPTYGVWESVDDIDWNSLPDRFIIKPTHLGGGAGVIVCKDKTILDIENAKKELSETLKLNLFPKYREWGYKNMKPRIIAEQLLEDHTCAYLRDYKFYCFNGEPKVFYITSDKGISETRQDFFDINGNHLELEDAMYPSNQVKIPDLPVHLDKMLKIVRELAKDIPHVRIDLYEIEDRIYFGEWTFYEGGGFAKFKPSQWNYTLGDWIKLPKRNN